MNAGFCIATGEERTLEMFAVCMREGLGKRGGGNGDSKSGTVGGRK